MFVGGLRGAVTLPLELDYWWTVQSSAFGVVIFTLFVQAPLLKPILSKWKEERSIMFITTEVL